MYLSFLGAADSLANTHFSLFHLQNMQSEYLSFHVNEERAPFPAFRACIKANHGTAYASTRLAWEKWVNRS